jgi:Fe-S-cluster containining protein
VNCLECRGACCEQLVLPLPKDHTGREFFLARGFSTGTAVILSCRCPQLTIDAGTCSIYERRPLICSEYKAGGAACLDAVRLRRSPANFQRIREAGDPEVL